MSDDVLLRVDGVSKKFCRSFKKSLWYGVKDSLTDLAGKPVSDSLRPQEFWAVNNVSFELRRGEALGLIGRNGAGKTTLLKMINGLLKPDKGTIEIHGRIGGLIALGAGFNPILSGRENIYVNAAVLGLSSRATRDKVEEIIDFAEVREFIDSPVQSYSSGMVVRLGFAVATAMKPDVLLLDEVLAVGDAAFKSKCWKRLGELTESTAVILVSHEAYAISRLCDRAALLDGGKLICDVRTDEALERYEEVAISRSRCDIETFSTTNKSIQKVVLASDTTTIKAGDFYEFFADIDAVDEVEVDYGFINISDSYGDVHAQSLIYFPNNLIRKGPNRYSFSLGPLFLTQRDFFISMMASSRGGKSLVLHCRGQLWFRFLGHISHGPKYYPPTTIRLLSTT